VWSVLPNGGLSQYVVVNVRNVSLRPRTLSLSLSASLPSSTVNAVRIKDQILPIKGQKVLLIGANSSDGFTLLQVMDKRDLSTWTCLCSPARTAALVAKFNVAHVCGYDQGEGEDAAEAELMLVRAEIKSFDLIIVTDLNMLSKSFVQTYLKEGGRVIARELRDVTAEELSSAAGMCDLGLLRPALDGEFDVKDCREGLDLLTNDKMRIFGKVVISF